MADDGQERMSHREPTADGKERQPSLSVLRLPSPVIRWKRRDLLRLGAAAVSAPALPLLAFAQGRYPERPIRLVVPFTPGGVNDAVGRPWADKMKSLLGTVVVENIGGAGGGLGAAAVARSEEHTSELQSLTNLVCRLLLEKKKIAHRSTDSA